MADDALAAFQAELAELEDAAEAAGDADDAPDGAAPPGSPEEKRFEDDDGTWYAWDPATRKFVPEGESVAAPPAPPPPPTWSEADMVFQEDDAPAIPSLRDAKRSVAAAKSDAAAAAAAPDSKHRAVATNAIEKEKARRAKRQAAKEAKEAKGGAKPRENTSAYVTGLPPDATAEEVKAHFAKCGVIMLDPDTNLPKVKLYRDEATGAPKGDALVTYLKAPSVALAVTILDDAPLRPGNPEESAHRLRVSAATFEKDKDGGDASKSRGSKRPTMSGSGSIGDKKRRAAFFAKQERAALDWGGHDDPSSDRARTTAVLTRMFTLDEMFGDPEFRVELEEDVVGECERAFGAVVEVKVHTTNPEGAVSVRFTSPEAAEKCVAAMRGRWFAGKQLGAAMWDGVTNYNKAGLRDGDEAEERARLEAFGAELEGEGAEEGGDE